MREKAKLTGVSVLLLAFQILYYQLTLVLIYLIMKDMPYIFDYFGLMVHHTLQFGLLFIPTVILQKKGWLDFGYRLRGIRGNVKVALLTLLIPLLLAIFSTFILGNENSITADMFLFQLFFSGLGEEIEYRAVPMTVLDKVMKDNPGITVFGRFTLDFPVIISAIMFGLGHISFGFMQEGVSFSVLQIVSAILTGLGLGYIFRRTKSIWFCMLLHGIYNVIAIGIPALAFVL